MTTATAPGVSEAGAALHSTQWEQVDAGTLDEAGVLVWLPCASLWQITAVSSFDSAGEPAKPVKIACSAIK